VLRHLTAFVSVATLGHSRRLHVRAFRHERQANWFTGLESAFTSFAASRTAQFDHKLIAFAKYWASRREPVRRIGLARWARPRTASDT
jgi:transposase